MGWSQMKVCGVLEDVLRSERTRLVATLVGWCRDMTLAEDVLQDAVEAAMEQWVCSPPTHPAAWLLNVARRRGIDRLRRRSTYQRKLSEVESLSSLETMSDVDIDTLQDDRLRLIFTCCHPALAMPARVALTLKVVAGWSTSQIAESLLVSETTMAQRIVRAKRKIRDARIPYIVPGADELEVRLDGVLLVLYLVFSRGYDDVTRQSEDPDLCEQAIELTAMLSELHPDAPEVLGLLALMMLHHSRRRARLDRDGQFVPLSEQDRTQWCQDWITRGLAVLGRALVRRAPGPYQIQAAISALHCESPSSLATDWPQIAALYHELYKLCPIATVALNRAMAVCNAHGAEVAWPLMLALSEDKSLLSYPSYFAALGHMHRELGRADDAAVAYQKAASLATSEVEREHLLKYALDKGVMHD